VERAWRPKARARPESEPKPDILAEHFGADWRTNFGFDAAEVEEPDGLETSPGDARDPYRVLEVEPDATWDEIVAAHRHQARVHHPDRLFGQSDDEKAEGEEQIRVINAAYQELRIRRGM
jgi:DnaJ like chaperone protein